MSEGSAKFHEQRSILARGLEAVLSRNHSIVSAARAKHILPQRPGGKAGYEQKAFPEAERKGKLRLVASPDGRDGSVTIRQDVNLYAGLLCTGEALRHSLEPGRHAWVHVARGQVELGGEQLEAGDAVAISDARGLEVAGRDGSEILLFDLA